MLGLTVKSFGIIFLIAAGSIQQPSSSPQPVSGDLERLPAEFLEKYFLRRMLGRGSFGTVRSVIDKVTGLECAAKIMPKQLVGKDPAKILDRIKEEVQFLTLSIFTLHTYTLLTFKIWRASFAACCMSCGAVLAILIYRNTRLRLFLLHFMHSNFSLSFPKPTTGDSTGGHTKQATDKT